MPRDLLFIYCEVYTASYNVCVSVWPLSDPERVQLQFGPKELRMKTEVTKWLDLYKFRVHNS